MTAEREEGHRGPLDGQRADSLPRVMSSRAVHTGRVVSMRIDEIATPQGSVVSREVVEHPGAVVVVAVDAEGYVYLVRQYRHPIGRYLVELPAGGLEPGEEPLTAARRELREEVGIEATKWTALGSFFSSPGFANEHLYAFMAEDLVAVESDPDDDEDLEVIRYPLERLPEDFSESADAKTLTALFLAQRLGRQVETS